MILGLEPPPVVGPKVYIYGLVDPRDGVVRYVGKAINPEGRFKTHLKEKGDTYKHRWVRKLNSLGLVPRLVTFQEVPRKEWQHYETTWIKFYKEITGAQLTNSSEGGDGVTQTPAVRKKIGDALRGRPGHKQTPEIRAKIGAAGKGKVFSEERKANISAALKGKVVGEETRKKMSENNKSKKLSDETRARMSASRKGKKHSPEHSAKIGAAHKGKKLTEEHKAQMSASRKGRSLGPCSEQTKAKISAAHMGKTISEEQRLKISESVKATFARKKQEQKCE